MNADMEVRDLLAELLAAKADGRIKLYKLYLIHKALEARKSLKTVFQRATYLPLRMGGKWGSHLLMFARRYRKSWAVTIVPRFLTRWVKPNKIPVGEEVWHDTHLYVRRPCLASILVQSNDGGNHRRRCKTTGGGGARTLTGSPPCRLSPSDRDTFIMVMRKTEIFWKFLLS